MKCSEYLWKRYDLMKAGGYSPERADGEMLIMLNGEAIVSDTDGKKMSQREANSVLGRNQKYLVDAYQNGQKSLFELVCIKQQITDDEYEAAKAEEEAKEEATEETPAEG